MLSITALLHTHNDALRVGRALEMLFPCDEILIVDHGSSDGTVAVARDYGARIMMAVPGKPVDTYLRSAGAPWVLCLEPRESLTESLAASLFEWKSVPDAPFGSAFSVCVREETASGWRGERRACTRLVPQTWSRWEGGLPIHDPTALPLEGDLLRFAFP